MNDHLAEGLLKEARRVLDAEERAIRGVRERIGANFVKAVEILAAARGRVIGSGIGKSILMPPPPFIAVLPSKMQPVTVGLLCCTLSIPPPPSAVLSMKRQSVMVG